MDESVARDSGHGVGAGSKVRLLVIQPTTFCNISCSYCYLPDRDGRSRMSLSTLDTLCSRLVNSDYLSGSLTVVWHAGEPLTVPVEQFEAMLHSVESVLGSEVSIEHSVQTNGLLINDRWVDLFERYRVNVGLSIDGPTRFHDVNRKTRSGKGTLERALRGLYLVAEAGLNPHVISVITSHSLSCATEFLEFYDHHRIRSVGFNVEEVEGPNTSSSLSGMEVGFGRFLCELRAAIREKGSRLHVREFDSMANLIRSSGHYNPQVDPMAIVTVDTEGRLYTFSPEFAGVLSEKYRDYTIGNIHSDTLADAHKNCMESRLWRDVEAGVELCRRTCDYFEVCGGGAPANKVFENGTADSATTLYCKLTKQVLCDAVLDDLEQQM